MFIDKLVICFNKTLERNYFCNNDFANLIEALYLLKNKFKYSFGFTHADYAFSLTYYEFTWYGVCLAIRYNYGERPIQFVRILLTKNQKEFIQLKII